MAIKTHIDLSGPQGNAFALLAIARRTAIDLDFDKGEVKSLMNEMQSSNYEHLLEVFKQNFGEYFTLQA